MDRRAARGQRAPGRDGVRRDVAGANPIQRRHRLDRRPHDYAHKGAYQSLAKIRELLWAGKQKEAEDFAMKEFMSEPVRQKAYQALGDLIIDTPGVENATAYKRSLDLDTGIASTEWTSGG